jgi:DNA (cytosine-5)-methyltransferase 1
MEKLKVLDLFSGIGGFSLGLERTGGFETVAFCEIDPFCQKVLKKHWPDVPIYNDVRNLEYDGSVDVITGGFPCQDISTAGEQIGLGGARSGLWSEMFALIGKFRPDHAIIENVSNLLTGERGSWFRTILINLASIGYNAEWRCVRGYDIQASHERERVYVVAYPSCIGQSQPREYFKSLHKTPDAFIEADTFVDAFQSGSLPFVCRGHDGVSKELGEAGLKALGNTIFPQIPEMIGNAILAAEKNNG